MLAPRRRSLSTLAEILDVIGQEALDRFVAAFGGTRIYVPGARSMHKGHPIARAIGFEAARLLSAYLGTGPRGGGQPLEVPRMAAEAAKKHRITTAEGSLREVARRFGCTERYVSSCRSLGRSRPSAPEESP